jgi:ABC-type glycerol-3-phosphate transport system permease component
MTSKAVIQNQRNAKSWGRSGGAKKRKALLYVIITIIALVYILPVLGVILTSFKLDVEIAKEGLWAIPKLLHLDNYKEVWVTAHIQTYMKNSFLVTIPATFISIFLGTLLGYVFSKLSFKGSETLFIFVLAGMFFPPQIVLIPLFKLYNTINVYDTLWAMIITHSAFGIPICTLIMRNFFSSIPMAIREAAIIDGANELDVLTRIMLPVSLPALAVLATLQFTWIWNDFLFPIIFTQTDEMRTIMVGLISMKGQYRVAYGAQGAMAVIASLPTLIVFIFFQRYFIKGMTMGAVKG